MRLLLVLALLGAAVAAPRNGQRIYGGRPTTIRDFPFMANMQFNVLNIMWQQRCGGTILTSEIILSGAHCYYGDYPAQWRVRLGSTNSNDGSSHQISRFVVHPEYDDELLKNDVALVFLATLAVYGDDVRGANLAGSGILPPDGTVVAAVGWGALYNNGPSAETLQYVEVNVINQELCAERYAYLKAQPDYENWPEVNDGNICTGILNSGGRDACTGDNGGPVVLGIERFTVVGLTSWGYSCGHEYYPRVNVRVPYYTNWILEAAASG